MGKKLFLGKLSLWLNNIMFIDRKFLVRKFTLVQANSCITLHLEVQAEY